MGVTSTAFDGTALEGTTLIGLPEPLTAEQAARPALLGREQLSYGELADLAGTLAARLTALGAKAGDRAAIWMDKQPQYAVAILGALHAGCAYVPLDGNQPAGRVETILDDAEPVVLFTDRTHLAALAGCALPASLRAIVVTGEGAGEGADGGGNTGEGEGPGPEAGACGGIPVRTFTDFAGTGGGGATGTGTSGGTGGGAALRPPLTPDDLAALLYTSGSTGVPKGVKISHRNLANFIGWARTELDVGPKDVFANHASFNFDLSTFDLFTALSAGAAVWIIEDGQSRDMVALASGILLHGVTVWYSVPSILSLLTRSGALTPEVCDRLRYVLFAGEVFPVPQLRDLAALLPPHATLYNLYGPTETNVCTYHRVREHDLAAGEVLPIGEPITGARVRIVDESGSTVEGDGALGELVVEGDCVTPGYWGREAEPMADGHRRSVHPTGDIVGLEDGRLVYRGRKDRMVKLNGYRLELGEIEAAVLRHPAIADAAVVVTGEGGGARLALSYTLREGADRPGLLALKQHCAQHLPKYMVPHTATCLEEMPRNANGKTDYRRLGEDGAARPAPGPVAAGARGA